MTDTNITKEHPKECKGDIHHGQNGTWKCWECGMIGGGFNDAPQPNKSIITKAEDLTNWERIAGKTACDAHKQSESYSRFSEIIYQGIKEAVTTARSEERRRMIEEFYLANKITATSNPIAVLNGILTAEEMEYGRSLNQDTP